MRLLRRRRLLRLFDDAKTGEVDVRLRRLRDAFAVDFDADRDEGDVGVRFVSFERGGHGRSDFEGNGEAAGMLPSMAERAEGWKCADEVRAGGIGLGVGGKADVNLPHG